MLNHLKDGRVRVPAVHPAHLLISAEVENPLDDVARVLLPVKRRGVYVPKKRWPRREVHAFILPHRGAWASAGQGYATQVLSKVAGIQQNIDFLAQNS